MKLYEVKIFILSPHIDDAAYGLTVSISKWVKNNIPVTIINCFTQTKWTIRFVSKDMQEICRLRKQEDEEYNKFFNSCINIIHLDLLDAPLRNDYIFQYKPFEQNELEVVEELKTYLKTNIPKDSVLLCPLAIGDHIDHVICREAVEQLYENFNILFFEDLPYANRISETEILSQSHSLEKRLKVHFVNNTNHFNDCSISKEQAIRLYKTQLNDEICAEIISHLNNLSGERLWGDAKVFELLDKEVKC
jgi:LmbE family N-acetylglucosaminyl deacetylase